MEPDARHDGAGEVESVPSPVPSPQDLFVITNAELPDHTVTPEDSDDALTARSTERTESLKALAGAISTRRPGRPRKEKAEKTPSAPKRVPAMPRGGLTKQLEQLYVGVGMALLFKDPDCGVAIIEAAPKCAETLNTLAEKNPAVRRVLLALCNTSAIGAVVMAHAPILWAISKHHVPAVRDSNLPELLDSFFKTDSTEESAA